MKYTKIEKLADKLELLKKQEQELLTKKRNLEKLQKLSEGKDQRKADNRLKILLGAVFLSNCSESDFNHYFNFLAIKDKEYVKKWLITSKIRNKPIL